jgi:hypothetical protein
MSLAKDYEDFQTDRTVDDGPSAEEHYEYEDLDLASLDTYVGDDAWHRTFAATGSVGLDPDWF